MKLRRTLLLLLALFLIVLVGVLYFRTRPAPILTVMTWPGAYGRAQASAQMHPYAAQKNVDVRTALWDGDLAEVAAMGEMLAYKADVASHQFPSDAESYHLPKDTQAALETVLQRKRAFRRSAARSAMTSAMPRRIARMR